MSSAGASGGYDYDFIDSPSEDLQCSICLSVLRDPQLTSCCGNHFCHTCVVRIQKDCTPCPFCQEKSFTTFLDKSIARKINELKVCCPNSEKGCQWTGMLKDVDEHLISPTGCVFVEIECVLCGETIFRHSETEHEANFCSERKFHCEHCGLGDTWGNITEFHLLVCERFPLPCPNKCGAENIKRKDLEEHVDEDCPLQVVPCQFDFVGCSVQLPRNEVIQHDSDTMASHLTLMAIKFKELLSENVKKDEKIQQLLSENAKTNEKIKLLMSEKDQKIAGLEAAVAKQDTSLRTLEVAQHVPRRRPAEPVRIPPVDLYMEDFEDHRDDEDQWFSMPFYSHPGGYKLCLSVFANGIGVGMYSHVSVFVNVMRGEYDDDLPWPFRGDIEVTLITDDEDYERTLKFTSRSPAKSAERVVYGEVNEYGQGNPRFVAYDEVSDQYTLHFRVTGVDCTCL